MLAATLIGCSCLMPPQASMEGFGRLVVADPPAELEPAPFTVSPATSKPKSTAAPKAAKPTSVAVKTVKPHAPGLLPTNGENPSPSPSPEPAFATN